MSAFSHVKILLLQARAADDPAKREEVESFARRSHIGSDQIETHDLLEGPPTLRKMQTFDAVMIGGAGDYYVSRRDLPAHAEIVAFLGELAHSGCPTFASCFGFQFLVEALGGEIIFDAANTEVGTFEMSLTSEGEADPLFGHLPPAFLAQLGRKDRAAADIQGIPTLARSTAAPIQAIRVPQQPVWATQFHPELDRETNLSRYSRYLEGYRAVMSEAEIDAALASFRESPETMDLLHRFLKLVLE